MNRFRLQSVLTYRKTIENMIRESLLICYKEEFLLKAERQKVQKEVRRLHEELQILKESGIPVCEMMIYENCIEVHIRHVDAIAKKLEALGDEIKSRQGKLIKARQEKRALEILNEKNDKEEKRQQRRRDLQIADESAIRSFRKRT